jgi:hypothetical protein
VFQLWGFFDLIAANPSTHPVGRLLRFGDLGVIAAEGMFSRIFAHDASEHKKHRSYMKSTSNEKRLRAIPV